MREPLNNMPLFEEHLSTLKKTSKDKGRNEYMTESDLEVVDFDKVKEAYIRGMALSEEPCSSDALYADKTGDIYFVEFKNGFVDKRTGFNICNKIYDSLLIFNDIMNTTATFCRKKVNFILVYNAERNSSDASGKVAVTKDMVEEASPSRAEIAKYFSRKAKKHFVRFGLEKFKNLYFRDVFTYTESEFEKEFLNYQ